MGAFEWLSKGQCPLKGLPWGTQLNIQYEQFHLAFFYLYPNSSRAQGLFQEDIFISSTSCRLCGHRTEGKRSGNRVHLVRKMKCIRVTEKWEESKPGHPQLNLTAGTHRGMFWTGCSPEVQPGFLASLGMLPQKIRVLAFQELNVFLCEPTNSDAFNSLTTTLSTFPCRVWWEFLYQKIRMFISCQGFKCKDLLAAT